MTNGDVNAQNINDSLMEAFENNQAKAVVLNINSPGGSPVQSDEIWQMAMMLRQEYPDKNCMPSLVILVHQVHIILHRLLMKFGSTLQVWLVLSV